MIITAENNYVGLDAWLADKKKLFLVCDNSFRFMSGFREKLVGTGISLVSFSDFQPNPLYSSVVKGVSLFREQECDCIIAVGGGSAMDVAKCIKLYSKAEGNGENGAWLKCDIEPEPIPFLAMPTTAGTGSEATRYAVIYFEGKKQSITNQGIIPDAVLLDPVSLKTLPLYQRKATMCDALCHAIESFWSVNSTEASKVYARDAISGVLANMDGYLNNTEEGNAGMLMAAHIAGKAINVTQTTAGHAMSYKLTSMFGIAHGHAVMLCDRVLYPWMLKHVDQCIDPRGEDYLRRTLDEIGEILCCSNKGKGAAVLDNLFSRLQLEVPRASEDQLRELKINVNPVRLKNHPISLDGDAIEMLYRDILR